MMALAIAMVMVICTMNFAVMAAPGDLSVNSTLTVSGLGEKDTVKYYQLLKWDPDDPNGWVWGNGVTVDADGKVGGHTVEDIIGDKDHRKDGQNLITDVIAGDLAGAVGTAATPAGTNKNGTWSVEGVDAGLYMVIVTSKTPGTMYNPIFVAANFYGNNEQPDSSNTWAVTSDATYSNTAMAKMSKIPGDKEASGTDDGDPDTVKVGDVIDYAVTSKIPKFASNYTNPMFQIDDELTGLELETVPKVYAVAADDTETLLTDGTEYDLLDGGAVGDDNYSIKFKEAYIKGVTHPGQKIVIKYQAKVTTDAIQSVNELTNEIEIKFSIDPDPNKGYGIIRDVTNHFTFSLDADLLGDMYENESATEAIKVGLDAEGNPVVSEKSYAFSSASHAALEGATFKLYTDEGCNTVYTNDIYPNGCEVVSDASGRLTILGLDVGNYWLKEESAPMGFIKAQEPIPVVITADITEDVEIVDEVDYDGTPVEVTYYTNVLNGYTVTVGGGTTTYEIRNSKYIATSVEIDPDSSDGELVNTKGVELPATGGIGTTIFYVIGAILVLGAGILLVTRRRMDTI